MPSSELINGVEVGPTALLPSVLQATLRRIAVSLLPDPTALPDGTLAQVVGGTWIAEPPAEAPTLLALSAPTASGMTLDWTPGDVSLHTEVWRGGVLLVTLNPGVATYNATGLDDNALYSWKVRHRTGDQFSAFSATETAWTLPLNFTGAPTLTSRTAVQFVVGWTNEDATAKTQVWVDDGAGGAFTRFSTVAAGVAAETITGLSGNKQYKVKLKHEGVTSGLASASFSPLLTEYTHPVDIAGAPTSGAQTATTLDIAWTNADATAQTEIHVDDGAGGAFSIFSTEAAAATTKQITGLTGNLPYRVKLKHKGAVSTLVSVNFSPTLTQYTLPGDIVGAPTSGAQTETTLDVAWANADATALTELWVDDGAGGAFALFSTEAAGATTKQITGRTGNLPYKVKARHKGVVSALLSAAYSPDLTQYTRPADIVGAPTSPAQGATTIDIAWVNADATAQTEVWVDDGAGGAFSLFSTEAAAATTKQITGLTAATTYKIKVRHKGVVSTLTSTNYSPDLTQATTA